MTPDLACDTVRETLSSRFDGEAPPPSAGGAGAVDRHLATCGACAAWMAGAERLHRVARVRTADAVPDLTRPVLEALVAEGLVGHRSRSAAREHRVNVLRVLLLALAAVQVLGALVNLAGGLAGDGHASSDESAFELAVAVTIGWAAFRPQVARAVTVLALPLAGCLVLTAAVGMARGVTAPHLEAHHLLTVATSVLAIALARTAPSGGRMLAA